MPISVQRVFPGAIENAWSEQIRRYASEKTVTRLWARDPTLWPHDNSETSAIADNLCWLDLPEQIGRYLSASIEQAAAAEREGFDRTVIVGMGGSNLCCAAVLDFLGDTATEQTFLLNTVDPDAIGRLLSSTPLKTTLYAFSSKSGKRIETHSLFLYLLDKLKAAGVDSPGQHFAALTDKNSYLSVLAQEYKFRTLLFDPPGISSRYSGLIHFGVALATVGHINRSTILETIGAMKQACGPVVLAEENPAVALAAFLAAGEQSGLNRLVLLSGRKLYYFAYRLAQLVGTSTAGNNQGLVPFFGQSSYAMETLQKNCMVVILRAQHASDDPSDLAEQLRGRNVPLLEIEIGLPADLVGEIFKWEIATALACVPLQTNCFKADDGQGNLAKVSNQLEAIVSSRETHQDLLCGGERLRENGICLYAEGQTRRAISSLNLREALRTFFKLRDAQGYIAICPFFELTPAYLQELRLMWDHVRGSLLMPVQAVSGPRYLYALSKIYKDGPPNGIFIIITSEPGEDIAIPGAGYTFGELQLAFSLTEFETLERSRRPSIRLHLVEGPEKGLKQLSDVVIQALAQIRAYG